MNLFRSIVLFITVLLFILDTSIANLALTTFSRSLSVDLVKAQWIITIFGVGVAVSVMATAKISDWFGRECFFLYALIFSPLQQNLWVILGSVSAPIV